MKQLTLAILIILSYTTLAHRDFCASFTEKNVTSRIKTGYKFEIINQAELIGKLVSKLSDSLGYTDPIFIDLQHDYLGENKACTYAVGYNTVYQCGDDLENKKVHGDLLFSNEVLTISIVDLKYEVREILTLVQALIQNQEFSTKEITCDTESIVKHWGHLKSIDQSTIKKILDRKPTGVVESILNDSIYLPSFQEGSLAYYWQNGNLFLQEEIWSNSSRSHKLVTIDTLSNILQLSKVGASYFIFENDSVFRFIDKSAAGYCFISRPIKLEKQADQRFRPYTIYEISRDRFSIYAKERVSLLIYNHHESSIELVLDLYREIDKPE